MAPPKLLHVVAKFLISVYKHSILWISKKSTTVCTQKILIKPHYIECDIYMISDCILKSTQRRSPNPGETRLLMRTKKTNLPRQPSEVEVVQPVSQIWMTTIQKAKVRSSKVKFVHRNEWSCFFINGWVRIQKIVALLFLTKLVLYMKMISAELYLS